MKRTSQRNKGMAEKHTKSLSLNPFYLFGEENWNKVFKQILRNEQACNLLPKSPEPYQEQNMSRSRCCLAQLTYP